MPNTIQLKRSSTAASAPTAGVLSLGELAINTADEKIFFKNSAGTVKFLSESSDLTTNLVTIASSQTITGLKTFDDEVTINSRLLLDSQNFNVIIGDGMPMGTAGSSNVSIGSQALTTVDTASNNVALGFRALKFNVDGSTNVAIGSAAARNCNGSNNTAIGADTLLSNTDGINNVALGYSSLTNLSADYSENTAIGSSSFDALVEGQSNVAVGSNAGSFQSVSSNPLETADESVFIGTLAKASADGVTNEIVIGHGSLGIGSNTVTIGKTATVANRFYGVISTGSAASTIASASTIAPTKPITFISGAVRVQTITVPTGIATSGGQITLIPTGAWSTGVNGNIALATTVVVNKALIMTYDSTTNKWYPSY